MSQPRHIARRRPGGHSPVTHLIRLFLINLGKWSVSSVVKPVQKLEYPPEDDPIVDHNCGRPNG